MINGETQDRKDYERIKEIAQKQMGKDAEKWIEKMEEFKKIVLQNKRNINKKYREISPKERRNKMLKQKETMKQRIETLKQYPYFELYGSELERFLTDNHGYMEFCEMVITDEFNVFMFETMKKQPIVVISGWWNKSDKLPEYHHIKAFCILPKNHKLTLNEFIKIEGKTKASEVKVINENEIIVYQKVCTDTYIKNINTIGKRPGYSLAVSRI